MEPSRNSTRQRSLLLCRVCRKPQPRLSAHHRKVCMKSASEAEIKKATLDAKNEVAHWMRHDRLWDYQLLQRIMAGPSPLARLVQELERRGNVVQGVLPAAPSPQATGPAPAADEQAEDESSCDDEDSGDESTTTSSSRPPVLQVGAKDCLAVLKVAKRDFLAVMEKLQGPDKVSGYQLTQSECLTVLYYLQAVVILHGLQRPGVVEHMTVCEWLARKTEGKHVMIWVKEYKTSSTTHVATFALSQEEEMWFDIYYKSIRPVLITGGRKRKRKRMDEDDTDSSDEDDTDNPEHDRFFVSSFGKAIRNPLNDLCRLHQKYNLPIVTYQMAWHAVETATTSLIDEAKSRLADYLLHSWAWRRGYGKEEYLELSVLDGLFPTRNPNDEE